MISLLFLGSHFILHLLHLSNSLILRLNILLNLRQILRNPSIILLRPIIFLHWNRLRRCQYILNRIWNNKVFIRLKPHNRLVIPTHNGWFSIHFLFLSSCDCLRAFNLFSYSGTAHCAGEFLAIIWLFWFIFS